MGIEVLGLSTTNTPVAVAQLSPNSQVIMSVPALIPPGGALGTPGNATTTVFAGLASGNLTATSGYSVNSNVPHAFSIPPSSQGGTLWAFSSAISYLTILVVTTT